MNKIWFVKDCQRLQQIILNCGWECTLFEAQQLWEERSAKYDAIWLILDNKSDEEIISELNQYTEEYHFELEKQ